MAKRGERRPWRVRFEWDNGVKGADSYSSESLAELKADEIRRAAESQDRQVTITIEDRRDGH